MKTSFNELLRLYRSTLLEDVIPFWMEHAIDDNGGINTCIQDDGSPVSRDRWNWSQWRAVWVFSKLHNRIEKRSEWLDVAKGIYRFVTAAGRDEGGHWPLLLSGDGEVLKGFESLYVDGFALYGLAELYRATKEDEVLDLALSTFEASNRTLSGEAPPPAWPYPIPDGRMAHGMSMLFSLAFHELAEVSGKAEVHEAALTHHRRVMDTFLRIDRGLLLEWLSVDGNEVEPPEGTAVCPGHAIESMWFQIHIALSRGDRETVERACEAIKTHLQAGWDPEFGGLLLAVDAEGREEVGWPHHQTKLWWPHTEALYATLLAYDSTGDEDFLEWHERVREYSYSHFPVPDHGEWTQKLTRQGKPIQDTLFLPVKDPFHLPRALYYCTEVLEKFDAQPRGELR